MQEPVGDRVAVASRSDHAVAFPAVGDMQSKIRSVLSVKKSNRRRQVFRDCGSVVGVSGVEESDLTQQP